MRTTTMLMLLCALACMSASHDGTAPDAIAAPVTDTGKTPAVAYGEAVIPRPASDVLMALDDATAPVVAQTDPECTAEEESIDGVCVSKAKLEQVQAQYVPPPEEDLEQAQQEDLAQQQEQHQQIIVQNAKVENMHDKLEKTEDKLDAILGEIHRRQEQGVPLLTDEEKEGLRAELAELQKLEKRMKAAPLPEDVEEEEAAAAPSEE